MAVITGGWSRERERSWLSGSTVAGALDGMGVKAHVLDLADSRDTLLEGLADASKAFLAIAGRGAEDGRLQGVLETLGVPYTGSGVLASAVGMHKLHAKTLVSAAGVRVPASVKIAPDANVEEEAARAKKALGIPLIVKPVSEGGSIGLYVATTDDFALPSAISCAKEEEWMAEAFHAGRSVSVGVLEDEQGNAHVLPPLEAQTPNGIYSYAAKRGTAVCDYHCPARVGAETLDDLERQAVAAHRALYCHSYSRHDFVVGEDGRAWWLEVNTLPGLSKTGNLARMALAAGISYELLLTHILRGADVDRRARP
ncbi:D-alanine--D-alanine ligase family protein [Streptomyces phaeofaciens]|uniref:D-alanine--D-alanine ligase family protein n=1 Tax=Streptomyces phaeofaciens TaxID=68254 RepID=UPI001672D5CA|nr:D-alanine--D-alanine ligase [Streptomyces phaeofaciens]